MNPRLLASVGFRGGVSLNQGMHVPWAHSFSLRGSAGTGTQFARQTQHDLAGKWLVWALPQLSACSQAVVCCYMEVGLRCAHRIAMKAPHMFDANHMYNEHIKDVGFVNQGQAAEIKLETFPYTRYGTVPATVTTITADAVMKEPTAKPDKDGKTVVSGGAVFPATLTLAHNSLLVDGKRIKLAPGMNLTAEIKTGQRRVIDYLLSPVQEYARESFRER